MRGETRPTFITGGWSSRTSRARTAPRSGLPGAATLPILPQCYRFHYLGYFNWYPTGIRLNIGYNWGGKVESSAEVFRPSKWFGRHKQRWERPHKSTGSERRATKGTNTLTRFQILNKWHNHHSPAVTSEWCHCWRQPATQTLLIFQNYFQPQQRTREKCCLGTRRNLITYSVIFYDHAVGLRHIFRKLTISFNCICLGM